MIINFYAGVLLQKNDIFHLFLGDVLPQGTSKVDYLRDEFHFRVDTEVFNEIVSASVYTWVRAGTNYTFQLQFLIPSFPIDGDFLSLLSL